MADEYHDERLESLERAVNEARSRLRSAETSLSDIESRIKNSENDFKEQLSEISAQYKQQTGANISRVVDDNGRVTYEFTREATKKEKRQRRTLTLRRNFTVQVENGSSDTTVNSAKELKKPTNRKRYIAYHFFGYRKLELSAEANPFLKVIGAPIVLPVQAAVKVAEAVRNGVEYVSETSVGKGVKKTAALVSSPVVIPYRVVKDIVEKGGVIHSVVDLGNKVRFEGKIPNAAQKVLNVAAAVSLTGETLVIETGKNAGQFTFEIAKEQLYVQVNQAISENDGTEAAYIIGMHTSEVLKILNQHEKYLHAVLRDKAGKDISDVNVSKYLAYKKEKRFQNRQDRMNDEKNAAKLAVSEARDSLNSAEEMLNSYRQQIGMSSIGITSAPENTATESGFFSLDRRIERTKRKLHLSRKHKYTLKFKVKRYNDVGLRKPIPLTLTVAREEITFEKPATLLNTGKNLVGYSAKTAVTSMRRKAMRDGSDNSAVEAANSGITALQQANKFVNSTSEKLRQYSEKHLESKLQRLKNRQSLEQAQNHSPLHERSSVNNTRTASNQNSQRRTNNRRSQRRNNQRFQELKKYAQLRLRQAGISGGKAAVVLEDFARSGMRNIGGIVVLIAAIVLLPIFLLMSCGSGTSASISDFVAPFSDGDLTNMDVYFTELAKNAIDKNDNIEEYYGDYDDYRCITEIGELYHNPLKFIPYIGAKISGNTDSDIEDIDVMETARPYIEEVFNSVYEFNAEEIIEKRNRVWTVKDIEEESSYYNLGGSQYTINGLVFDSADYTGYMSTEYTYSDVVVWEGYIDKTIENVGKYDDYNGNTIELDEAQPITFSNHYKLYLIFEWSDENEAYYEKWLLRYDDQEYEEYDYYILQYGITQKENFDTLMDSLIENLNDTEKEYFDNYSEFFMGHQQFDYPFENGTIVTNYGYGTTIGKDTSFIPYIEMSSNIGDEIKCGMEGKIIPIEGGNGFAVTSKKIGSIYYENCTIPENNYAERGEVVSVCTGDRLRITFIDKDGNSQNPIFLFD